MSFRSFPNITPNEPWSRVTAAILQWIRNGKLNNVGEVTLTANSATTTLNDALIGPDSMIGLMPMHADAAGALSGLYFSAPTTGTVTINHANTASTNKKFRYTVTG